jgi:LCP family protein required for cell wall assembly
MDSLRKKVSMDLEKSPLRRPVFTEASQPTKGELFISRQEAQELDKKYEKSFKQAATPKKSFSKIIGFILIFFIILALAYFGYFAWKTIATANRMNSAKNAKPASLEQNVRAIITPIVPAVASPLKGEAGDRINILLLGAAGEKNAGRNLTDTVMVMSIDTKNKKVALLSLPRDLYVNLPGTQTFTKINSVYKISLNQNLGVEPIKKVVEKITGLPINYYLIVNFDGFTQVIDDIGGINLTVERDIYDPRYPGPNYSYETFSLSKGFHSLDGATALKYVRQRHGDPEGDFGRAKRQQQVIQAVKNKLFSLETFFNVGKLNDVLTTLGDNINTDIATEEIGSFINLSKNVDTQNINNVVVDAWKPDSLLKVSHVAVGDVMAFILVPRVGNYSEIQDVAQNIFNQTEIKKRQVAIAEEEAAIEIINQSGDRQLATKVREILTENLGLTKVTISSASTISLAEQTFLQDNTNGAKLFTLDELLKKLPAKLASEKIIGENSKAELLIILGKDLVENYKFETDSIEDYNKAQDSQANFDFTSESQN